MADKKKTEGKIAKKTDAETEPGKRIYRSQSDKVIGGVCGGLAEYVNIDALIVRIIWAVAFFVGGIGFLAYIACWIIIPENPSAAKDDEKSGGKSNNSTLLWGFVLIFIGACFLLREFNWFDFYPFHWSWHWPGRWLWSFRFDLLLPVALILIGVIYLLKVSKSDKQTSEVKNKQTSGGKTMANKLIRSVKDKMIGGVCGGLAEHFNIDPSLVRVGFVLVTFASGIVFGVIAYIVMMIIIPEETAFEASATAAKTTPAKTTSAKTKSK